jgi:hypothetical protein
MKAERRHELKENDLVHALESGREYVRKNGQRIGLYVVGMVAVVAIVVLIANARTRGVLDAYAQMGELKFETPESAKTDLKTLDAIIAGSSDRSFQLTGMIRKAEIAMLMASDAGATPDRELLEIAKTSYRDLLAKFPGEPVAIGVAHLGLATIAENEFVLDPNHSPSHREEARSHLQAIKDNAALSTLPVYRVANDRLAALDQTFTVVKFAPAPPPPMLAAPDAPPAEAPPAGSTESIEIAPPAAVPGEQPPAPAGEEPAQDEPAATPPDPGR